MRLFLAAALTFAALPLAAQCVDYSKDPAGCQPSTFDTPIGQMPSVRVNKDGKIDKFASEADVRAGAAKLEKDLHLYRNFEPLHWVLTVPSVKDAGTGAWKGGDLDAEGDGRGLAIAGNCIYTGHQNGAGRKHAVNIFKIQANPEKQPPVQVGEIPAMFVGNEGFDDRELRALVYKTASGEDRYIMIRNAGTNTLGKMVTYKIDPAEGEGDVKYHKGYSRDVLSRSGKKVHLSLANNPSHLEFVNPVVTGIVRAKQELIGDQDRTQVLPILIHGVEEALRLRGGEPPQNES